MTKDFNADTDDGNPEQVRNALDVIVDEVNRLRAELEAVTRERDELQEKSRVGEIAATVLMAHIKAAETERDEAARERDHAIERYDAERLLRDDEGIANGIIEAERDEAVRERDRLRQFMFGDTPIEALRDAMRKEQA